MVIGDTGAIQGQPGFARGAVPRLDPSFNDFQMQNRLPTGAGLVNDRICKATQTIGNYTDKMPALRAHAGDYIAIQYQENGHVTLPQLSPQKHDSGLIYIYGTASPSNDDMFLSIHQAWNKDGTGGDRRGRLLAVRNFDDGQCYQINTGPISQFRQQNFPKVAEVPQGADLWCQNDIRLPGELSGSYSLYWVWDWPSQPSDTLPIGQPEIYTSCVDVEIIPGPQGNGVDYQTQVDLNVAAIAAQLREIDAEI